MTILEFIRENREEIDLHIGGELNQRHPQLNDAARESWILNDETLYVWAKREGVDEL